MSATSSNLEIHGTLSEHPFAELVVEAAATQLSGSFRLSHESNKVIVYLRKGEVVFAVSNARQHRLFEQLMQTGKLQKEMLKDFPNFTNDLEFGQSLIEKEIFSKEDIDAEFSCQIESILKTIIYWETGEWIFSPLARIRENIAFTIDLPKILMEFARQNSAENFLQKFKSVEETFEANSSIPQLNLSPQEGFIFSRFENQSLRIHDVQILCGLPDSEVIKSLYILWLGGFIKRKKWNSAFTENQLMAINSAKLTLKKDDLPTQEKQTSKTHFEPVLPENPAETTDAEVISEKDKKPLSVEEYLNRVESAENHYETLDIPFDAETQVIKTAYFALAKSFHPDKYHQESDSELQQRIQNAFTDIAKAYEILKTQETRQVYDFKLRKVIEAGVSLKKETEFKNLGNEDKAKEEFQKGYDLLTQDNIEEAIPYLTRAVHLFPSNARYHAYFGKALSGDERQRFKADAELQTAVRLDPNNPTFRLLLAEFYIQYNLLKRAEGELNRLLAIAPNNKEAQNLLDSLAKK